MTDEVPLVTVVVPARNEEADIEACLRAVLAQDHPADRLEVIVVDGASEDRTAEVAEAVLGSAERLARACVMTSAVGTTPTSLNLALGEAGGEYLCRVDARSIVRPDHVRRCVDVLRTRSDVAVVGGAQVAEASPGASLLARGIAAGLRNPWAMGASRYRRRVASGPTDTVYLGAFRTADLRRVGGWDERFLTNQDFELNRRLGRDGLVWFESTIAVEYRPRRTLPALAQQYRRFGRWKAAGWLEAGVERSPRQSILIAVPPAVGAAALLAGRRHPGFTAAAVLAGAGATVATTGPAPIGERVIGALAAAVAAGAWWAGIVEQTGRHRGGERLLA